MAFLLHQLLTQSAERYPEKEALIDRDETITYRALDHLSDQVARTLRMHGVAKGDRVGIYLNRSIRSVVAIFGILKAGGVYVPLDPSAPVRRVAFMIEDCSMNALVTTAERFAQLREAASASSPERCVPLALHGTIRGDSPMEVALVTWEAMSGSPWSSRPPADLIENDLAYILYTSGSTGVPKGVMISHRASLTFVNWAHECFRVQAVDRVSSHAPFHFDLSIFDIFATIKAGGTVILVPEELSVFPLQLADFIEQQRISIWYSVPSVLTRLVLHGKLERYRFPHLRQVLFAGEVFPVKYLRQLKALIPRADYCNLYGPTETNVCTFYPVTHVPADSSEPFPIGRACANTEVCVVTERNELARPGEVGELYVRGPSLMKGYWGDPEKTKRVLVSHPVPSPLGEEIVYRTGDLVIQAPDGNYLFLGRRDSMIKSRGYRIELGEIESTLYSHPEVEEAAVIAIPDEEIGNQIKAVVVIRNPTQSAEGDLRCFCAERIPKYMVPGIVEFRSSLPKTSTGKIDKTRLRQEHLEDRSA